MFKNKKTNTILWILISLDVLFILGHISLVLSEAKQPNSFLLDAEDWGYPELFQYVKYSTILGLVTYLIIGQKKYAYVPAIPLFVLLFIDDVFQLHYKAAWYFVYHLKITTVAGIKAVAIGQLLYYIGIGFGMFLFSLLFYKNATYQVKKAFAQIGILLVVFLFFGIGIDFLSVLLENYIPTIIKALLTVVEEGGEMISLSLLVWFFCYLLKENPKTHDSFFSDFKIK